MRMWQEEATRVIGFATEQELNRFVRVKTLPENSPFQAAATPLRVVAKPPPGDASPPHVVTFMGRTLEALLALTHPSRTGYGPGPTGGAWYDAAGRELAGTSLFVALNETLGIPGLSGLDKLLGFTAERELTALLRAYASELKAGAGDLLARLGGELQPLTATSAGIVKTLDGLAAKLGRQLAASADRLVALGHAQLLRRALAHELRFSCRLDSNFLCGAVEVVNEALLADVRRHYCAPAAHALPREENPLLASAAGMCEAVGLTDALTAVYLTVDAALQPPLGLWLALVAIAAAERLAWDTELGNLVARRAAGGKEPPPDAALPAGLDGAPLVAGFATLLKQLHPAVTDDFVAHVAQYLRSTVGATTGAAVVRAAADGPRSDALKECARAPPALPRDAFTLLLLLQQVARVAHVPERVLAAALPSVLQTVA
jgi:WASH complex subunit strumpellin